MKNLVMSTYDSLIIIFGPISICVWGIISRLSDVHCTVKNFVAAHAHVRVQHRGSDSDIEGLVPLLKVRYSFEFEVR